MSVMLEHVYTSILLWSVAVLLGSFDPSSHPDMTDLRKKKKEMGWEGYRGMVEVWSCS